MKKAPRRAALVQEINRLPKQVLVAVLANVCTTPIGALTRRDLLTRALSHCLGTLRREEPILAKLGPKMDRMRPCPKRSALVAKWNVHVQRFNGAAELLKRIAKDHPDIAPEVTATLKEIK